MNFNLSPRSGERSPTSETLKIVQEQSGGLAVSNAVELGAAGVGARRDMFADNAPFKATFPSGGDSAGKNKDTFADTSGKKVDIFADDTPRKPAFSAGGDGASRGEKIDW